MFDTPSIKHIVIGLATGAVIWTISAFAGRTRPRMLAGGAGRIAPNQLLTGLVVLGGLGLGGAALWASLFVPGSFPAPIVGGLALLFSGLAATSLLPVYAVSWDEDGISGPTSLWPMPIGPKPGRIAWEDVEEMGPDFGSGWFVADAEGRRVRWNYLYAGYPLLMQEVQVRCPWLFEPPGPMPSPRS